MNVLFAAGHSTATPPGPVDCGAGEATIVGAFTVVAGRPLEDERADELEIAEDDVEVDTLSSGEDAPVKPGEEEL